LRDRALIGFLVYSFTRIGAALATAGDPKGPLFPTVGPRHVRAKKDAPAPGQRS
jgi:hypothetical protein